MSAATVFRDLAYDCPQGTSLLLDIHRPEGEEPCPVILYVHGGGWRSGDKEDTVQVDALIARGFAVATITYRLLPAFPFPAQVCDVKAAIRWLRANGRTYGLATDKIGAWGHSAGAHLVALCAVTNSLPIFDEGENLGYSSRLDAVCCVAGFFDFLTLARHRKHGAEDDLLGHEPGRCQRAAFASPVTYLSASAPPFLLIHGLIDDVVPARQSQDFDASLRETGVPSHLILQESMDHRNWGHPDVSREMPAFFQRTISPASLPATLPS
ncbi:acetyl esterase [Terrimicrobium sacchariphilum]|uniref:Acetyl esterase n=1 Tax=Terrimicrobium sacchariphilum TaxID=690879 RepID=A0A146G7B1_TERSA|nr:alpha/beta hydrolase [Terrimicrobium sacchariphilum]GAT32618.1 acetyl esterase [Terrimicrobium sacchariphilum]